MSDESRKGKPRVVEPQRRQGVIRFEMPEDKLPATHTARVLWDVIGALDLTAFLDGVNHGAALDQLMTDLLASLMHKGVLSLDLVAQDGIRIRASATAPSFRRLESFARVPRASGAAPQGDAGERGRP